MVVKTKPFEYRATFLKKESPDKYEVSGTVYENDEDGALDAIERMYENGRVGILRTVEVKPRWAEEGEGCMTVTRYVPQDKPEAKPTFVLGMIDGMEYFIDYYELEVKPFTYKEKSNDD